MIDGGKRLVPNLQLLIRLFSRRATEEESYEASRLCCRRRRRALISSAFPRRQRGDTYSCEANFFFVFFFFCRTEPGQQTGRKTVIRRDTDLAQIRVLKCLGWIFRFQRIFVYNPVLEGRTTNQF